MKANLEPFIVTLRWTLCFFSTQQGECVGAETDFPPVGVINWYATPDVSVSTIVTDYLKSKTSVRFCILTIQHGVLFVWMLSGTQYAALVVFHYNKLHQIKQAVVTASTHFCSGSTMFLLLGCTDIILSWYRRCWGSTHYFHLSI